MKMLKIIWQDVKEFYEENESIILLLFSISMFIIPFTIALIMPEYALIIFIVAIFILPVLFCIKSIIYLINYLKSVHKRAKES